MTITGITWSHGGHGVAEDGTKVTMSTFDSMFQFLLPCLGHKGEALVIQGGSKGLHDGIVVLPLSCKECRRGWQEPAEVGS